MKERIINSLIRYKEAESLFNLKKLNEAYSALVDTFYLRCTEEDFISLEFSTFFRYHFNHYLIDNNIYSIELATGDAIADIIKDSFDNKLIEIESSVIIPCNKWSLLLDANVFI